MEQPSFFDYENYRALMAAVARQAREGDPDAAEDMEFIAGHCRNFFAYVKAVCESEVGIHLASGLEGEEKRQRIQELDRMRTQHHEAAIASAPALNRIAAFYGVGPLFTGDPGQRRQVASLCMEATAILFENRR